MAITTDPTRATQKWVNNLSGSTESIRAGVAAVSTAPGQRAAAQRAKWLARIQSSADKWAQRVGSVSLGDWQAAMVNVGIPRVAQGAQAKQAKFQNFMTEFLPHLSAGVAKVDAMPSTSLEDNINRAVTMIRHNSTFRRRGA